MIIFSAKEIEDCFVWIHPIESTFLDCIEGLAKFHRAIIRVSCGFQPLSPDNGVVEAWDPAC